MEERKEFKDDFIKEIVKKGNRTISNENFENQLMQKIYARTAYKKEVVSKIKRSMYFFFSSLTLVVVYLFSSIINTFALNNIADFVSILGLFFTLTVGITFANNYKKLLHSFSV